VLVLLGIASCWTLALRSLRIEAMTGLRSFTTERTDPIAIHGQGRKMQTVDAAREKRRAPLGMASQGLRVLSALCGYVCSARFVWRECCPCVPW